MQLPAVLALDPHRGQIACRHGLAEPHGGEVGGPAAAAALHQHWQGPPDLSPEMTAQGALAGGPQPGGALSHAGGIDGRHACGGRAGPG